MSNMRKHRFIYAALAAAALALGACSDFLDETADKSGNAYIYHMDQLYGLTGDPSLYIGSSTADDAYFSAGSFMQEQFYMGDGVGMDPDFYSKGQPSRFGSSSYAYSLYSWDGQTLKNNESVVKWTWRSAYDRIYTFNTVLENVDNVMQTTRAVHDQVKGEAYFGRAFFHFMLLTQYCRWEEDAPGIGYRDNTLSTATLNRETVASTLEHIYADLDSAEVCLARAGRDGFDGEFNTRPTVPTVCALRARVALYRGDYETALAYAGRALEGNNTLEDIAANPDYALTVSRTIRFLDEDGQPVDSIYMYSLSDLFNLYNRSTIKCPEIYTPCLSATDAIGWMPVSEPVYDLFTDKEHDKRWTLLYSSHYGLMYASTVYAEYTSGGITWETQQWLKPWHYYTYWHFHSQWGPTNVVGMTTGEMYVTQAECLARAGRTDEAAEVLKTLRRARFTDQAAADNIGGTVQDCLDERAREMGPFWRFYDAKRLNGAENAGIEIRRQILATPSDPNSVTELVIPANDPRWALPFNEVERQLLGWEQNEGWE